MYMNVGYSRGAAASFQGGEGGECPIPPPPPSETLIPRAARHVCNFVMLLDKPLADVMIDESAKNYQA